MDPINYDHTSGVIIDHCPLGHGNWLDASELEKVQAHREYWDNRSKKLEGGWGALVRYVLDRRGSNT
jgi:Zn-finger nucleic acid-binding protein